MYSPLSVRKAVVIKILFISVMIVAYDIFDIFHRFLLRYIYGIVCIDNHDILEVIGNYKILLCLINYVYVAAFVLNYIPVADICNTVNYRKICNITYILPLECYLNHACAAVGRTDALEIGICP